MQVFKAYMHKHGKKERGQYEYLVPPANLAAVSALRKNKS
jgi:hypothetical protein